MKKDPISIKTYCILLFLMLALPWPEAAAQGNLVVNGGFDAGASSWTTNVWSGYYSLKGNPGGGFELTSSTSNKCIISQTVRGLVPSHEYVVSGSYSIDGGYPSPNPSFGVAMDADFLFQVVPLDYQWRNFSFRYVAASSNVTLSLATHINGTWYAYRIDNIAMQEIPRVALRASGTNVVVSWPTNTVGFSLQSATNWNAASWATVTNHPVTSGTNYSVTVRANRRTQFFRLRI
jgi:hypothetical protein